jgi:folate-binding protein YgfZ
VFRATRRGSGPAGDEWWLDTEPQAAERLASGLARFRIRVKADLEDRTAATACASVVGAPVDDPDPSLASVATAWGDRPGVDVVGPGDAVTAWVAACGLRVGARAELEVLRIEAGVPAQGVDIDESTIPQEAFLERDAVSFTKGCFIGQELVCRIDTRGHVNRFLRRLAITGAAVPAAGADVRLDGKAVGAVTSAASVPGEDRVVALAMLRREVEPPVAVTVAVDGDDAPATVLL